MTPRELDERLLRRALDLARGGRGRVEPNPMVGCVIARGGQIIGEGFHRVVGGAHAEPDALARCTEDPAGADFHVTLEPCCHEHKRTPPCVPRVIAARPARVVIGCLDPNPPVAGRGLAMLRAAGIDAAIGPIEPECRQFIAPFTARIIQGRPYITLKWAQSRQGAIGLPGPRPAALSGPQANAATHRLRGYTDAIMVGIATALCDDPLLTVRDAPRVASRPLERIVLDQHLRLPADSRLAQSAREHHLLLLCAAGADAARAALLRRCGVEIADCPIGGDGRIDLALAVRLLADRGICHLLIESGGGLARALIGGGLVDRVWIIETPTDVPDPGAPRAPTLDWPCTVRLPLGGDTWVERLNAASAVFCACVPSPDMQILAGDSSAAAAASPV